MWTNAKIQFGSSFPTSVVKILFVEIEQIRLAEFYALEGSNEVDSRLTLIRFWFRINSFESSEKVNHDSLSSAFGLFYFDSWANHASYRIKIKSSENE